MVCPSKPKSEPARCPWVVRRFLSPALAATLLAFAAPLTSTQAQTIEPSILDLAGAPIAAPSDPTLVTTEADWSVRCTNPAAPTQKSCHLEHRIITPGHNEAIATMQVRQLGQKDEIIGIVSLPLGILVSAGITMRVDRGKTQPLAVRSCHVSGCLVPFRLSKRISRDFTRGLAAQIAYTGPTGEKTALDASLMGFTAARQAWDELPE